MTRRVVEIQGETFVLSELPGGDVATVYNGRVISNDPDYSVADTFFDMSGVQWALLEGDGEVSAYFFPHPGYLPVVACASPADTLNTLQLLNLIQDDEDEGNGPF